MTPEEYRLASQEISPSGNTPALTAEEASFALYGLGVAGEAGEVADIVKKYLFHGQPLDEEHLIKECGDVLWYIDRVLKNLGVTIEECLEVNVHKLRARYPGGWAAADKHYDHGDE